MLKRLLPIGNSRLVDDMILCIRIYFAVACSWCYWTRALQVDFAMEKKSSDVLGNPAISSRARVGIDLWDGISRCMEVERDEVRRGADQSISDGRVNRQQLAV